MLLGNDKMKTMHFNKKTIKNAVSKLCYGISGTTIVCRIDQI